MHSCLVNGGSRSNKACVYKGNEMYKSRADLCACRPVAYRQYLFRSFAVFPCVPEVGPSNSVIEVLFFKFPHQFYISLKILSTLSRDAPEGALVMNYFRLGSIFKKKNEL